MKLNHKPAEINDGFSEGIYDFRITSIEMRNQDSPKGPWSSGNDGMSLTVECYGDGVSFNTWENFTFTPRALYKLREVCEATGLDFNNDDLDTQDLINKTGKVAMIRKEGSKYLEVDYWISKDEAAKDNTSGTKKKAGKKAAPVSNDDVPF